jgi:hypothetical protein
MKIQKLKKKFDPASEGGVYKIVNALDARMRKAFLKALDNIKDAASLTELEKAFETGGIYAAIDSIGSFNPYFEAELVPELEDAVSRSGRLAVTTTLDGKVNNTFKFSMLNPATVEAVNSHGAALVSQISDNTRAGIIEANRIGLITGSSPKQTARMFRDSIGLTENQANAVNNYKQALINNDANALNYSLRDKRFDSTVRQLIDTNKVDMVKIDKMVQRYTDKYIKYRSEVIARTESMRAISMGDFEAGRQAEESGAFGDETYKRFWIDTGDSRERASHFLISGMNPEGRGYNEPFQTPLGPLKYPRDPSGTARNTVQCRCTTVLRRVGSYFNR